MSRAAGIRTALWWAIGLALLVAAAAATIRVPVYGDDFRLSQQAYDMFDGDLGKVLATAWKTGEQPNRFSPSGRFFAFAYHFLAHELAVNSGIGMHWFYRAGGFILLVLAVVAASALFVAAARYIDPAANRIRLAPVFSGLSAGLAVTLQLHPWSHDPVLTISEIGLMSSVLTFAFLALVFSLAETARLVIALPLIAAMSVIGTTFYESFVAAVVAATLLWGWMLVRPRSAAERMRAVWFLIVGTLLPLVVFVGGRMYVATLRLAPYSGTDLALTTSGFRPFGLILLGVVPGSAWPLSVEYAGGRLSLTFPAVAAGLAIALLLAVGTVLARREPALRLVLTRRGWTVAVVLGTLAVLTVAMHSFTEKYIAELTRPGQIYLSYVLLALLALMSVLAAVLGIGRRRMVIALVLLPVAAGFAVVQQAVNWSVAERAAVDNDANRYLTSISVRWEPNRQARCASLAEWADGKAWPAYYRAAVVNGINHNYERDFGVPFCADVPDARQPE